jgi:hypothetical protein
VLPFLPGAVASEAAVQVLYEQQPRELQMLGYLDAGTGSMIVGAVAAGAAGVGVAVRAGLGKFKRKGRDEEPSSDPQLGDESEPATEDADA